MSIHIKIVCKGKPDELQKAINKVITDYITTEYKKYGRYTSVKDIKYTHTVLPPIHFAHSPEHWFTAYITFFTP